MKQLPSVSVFSLVPDQPGLEPEIHRKKSSWISKIPRGGYCEEVIEEGKFLEKASLQIILASHPRHLQFH